MGHIRLRRYCSCYGCRSVLRSFWAAYAGVCDDHYRFVKNDDFWVGVCWNCGSITAVGPRRDLVKDKYIFAKGCKRCTDDEEMNISWMTIKKETPPSTYVTPTNTLVPINPSNQLRSGNPSKDVFKDVRLGFTWDE